jgi:hypothetical protein
MDRVKYLGMEAKEFAHEHKDCIVIIADAKTDHILAAYGDSYIYGEIKNVMGMNQKVVKEMLMASKFAKGDGFPYFKLKADMFLSSLAELLWVPVGKANEFYKFVSDALWYLPKKKVAATGQSDIITPKGQTT